MKNLIKSDLSQLHPPFFAPLSSGNPHMEETRYTAESVESCSMATCTLELAELELLPTLEALPGSPAIWSMRITHILVKIPNCVAPAPYNIASWGPPLLHQLVEVSWDFSFPFLGRCLTWKSQSENGRTGSGGNATELPWSLLSWSLKCHTQLPCHIANLSKNWATNSLKPLTRQQKSTITKIHIHMGGFHKWGTHLMLGL